jgi:mannose-6-phosphate isomerase-like protein (cupin superfamily)
VAQLVQQAQIVHSDSVFRVDPGTTPDYDTDNPLLRLLAVVEDVRLAASREVYDPASVQYLFPLSWLQLYGPSAPNSDVLDPAQQDVKTDFQKQNVRDFRLGDTRAVRGWAFVGGQRLPFLQLSYRGGPDSALAHAAGSLGAAIGCTVRIGGVTATVRAPYVDESARYVVELWGRPGDGLHSLVDARGGAALDAGVIQARPDLVQGGGTDFDRLTVEGRDLRSVSPLHAMHPVLPMHVDVRWSAGADGGGASDPPVGATRLGFEMQLRGWNNYLGVGVSPNPHGGVGNLEYRNLLSQYGRYSDSQELLRRLEPWNLDAFGHKGHSSGDVEPFFAVDYMDLHVLEPACGIGLHRHRDNQEVFLMLDGEGIMVVGDWADSGTRQRSFEVRALHAGELAMLRGGNLHALVNPGDRRSWLFMFGGYD